MLFSERIRTLRNEQKILQRKLAKAIGVDPPMYSRYEHGERFPKRDQVLKLARLLGADANELVALWLAEKAMNTIGSDRAGARAADLLREQLAGADPAAQPVDKPAPVVQPAAVQPETEPETDPLILKAAAADPASRRLLRDLGDNLLPQYIVGDARQTMAKIEDESIDCIVTTPPYWNLRSYNTESISARTLAEFSDELMRVMAEAWRVLKPTGSLWLNLADHYEDRAMAVFPWRMVLRMIDRQGWILRNDVVWNKPQGAFDSGVDHLRNVHEFMFHLVKSLDYHFDLQQARSGVYFRNEGKMIPGDVWKIAPESSGIDRYRVMPESLCRFPIDTTCPRGGIVLDPYCGTGTTCKVAYDLNRRSIGIDINPDRIERAKSSVEQKPLSLF